MTTGFLAVMVGGIYALPFVAKDAFAGYKSPKGPLGGETGIRMDDVQMRAYDKGNLVAQAHIDRVDVRKDRQFFGLTGIRDGALFTEEGRVDFRSSTATYDDIAEQMRFDAGVHFSGDDFALHAPRLTLDRHSENWQAPGPVTGTFKGGRLYAMGLKYKMANKEFLAGGPVRWKGKLPQDVAKEVPVGQAKTPWDIEGRNFKTKDNISTWTDGRATDGEIIVKAPNIQHDKKGDVLTCTGKVYYFSKKANLVADKAIIYRKEKRAVLTGNVRMLVKPKDKPDLTEQEIPPFRPDVPESIAQGRPEAPTPEETQQQKDLDEALRSAKTVRDYPSMVKSEQVEYWYAKGSRHAIVTGSPEAYQAIGGLRWRRVSAFKGLYDGELETLRMESSAPEKREVRYVSSIGDDMYGWWFLVSTKEDDDAWEGDGVKGQIMTDEDEIPKEKKTPPPTGGGGTSG